MLFTDSYSLLSDLILDQPGVNVNGHTSMERPKKQRRVGEIIAFFDDPIKDTICFNASSLKSNQKGFYSANERDIHEFLTQVVSRFENGDIFNAAHYIAVDVNKCMFALSPIFAKMSPSLVSSGGECNPCSKLLHMLNRMRSGKKPMHAVIFDALDHIRSCDLGFTPYLCFLLCLETSWRLDKKGYENDIRGNILDFMSLPMSTVTVPSILLVASWQMVIAFQSSCTATDSFPRIIEAMHRAEDNTMDILQRIGRGRIYQGTGIDMDENLSKARWLARCAINLCCNGLMNLVYGGIMDGCERILQGIYRTNFSMTESSHKSCKAMAQYLSILPFTEYIPMGYYMFMQNRANVMYVEGIVSIDFFPYGMRRSRELYLIIKLVGQSDPQHIVPLRFKHLIEGGLVAVVDWESFHEAVFRSFKERRCMIFGMSSGDVNFVPEELMISPTGLVPSLLSYRACGMEKFSRVQQGLQPVPHLEFYVGRKNEMTFLIHHQQSLYPPHPTRCHATIIVKTVQEAIRCLNEGLLPVFPEGKFDPRDIFSERFNFARFFECRVNGLSEVKSDVFLSSLRCCLSLCNRQALGKAVGMAVRSIFVNMYHPPSLDDCSCIQLRYNQSKVHCIHVLHIGMLPGKRTSAQPPVSARSDTDRSSCETPIAGRLRSSTVKQPRESYAEDDSADNSEQRDQDDADPTSEGDATYQEEEDVDDDESIIFLPDSNEQEGDRTPRTPGEGGDGSDFAFNSPELSVRPSMASTPVTPRPYACNGDNAVLLREIEELFRPEEDHPPQYNGQGDNNDESNEPADPRSPPTPDEGANDNDPENNDCGNDSEDDSSDSGSETNEEQPIEEDGDAVLTAEDKTKVVNDFLNNMKCDPETLKRHLCLVKADQLVQKSEVNYWMVRSRKIKAGCPLEFSDIVICFVHSFTLDNAGLEVDKQFDHNIRKFSKEQFNENLMFLKKQKFNDEFYDGVMDAARDCLPFMLV